MSVCVAMAAIAACGPAAPAGEPEFCKLWRIKAGLRLRAGPNLLFHDKEKPGVDDEEDQHAKAEAFACLEFRFGGPHQEGSNILGVLLNRLGRAVRVVDTTIAQRLGHGDLWPGAGLAVSILRGWKQGISPDSALPLCRTSPDRPGGAATVLPLTWHLPYSRTMPPAGQFRPLISWAGLP
jgi:hypothetical protein